MSNLDSNSKTDGIVRDVEYIRYTGQYLDDYENNWRVAISGKNDDVMSIMGERKFVLNAIPEEAVDAFEAQMKNAPLLGDDLDPNIEDEGSVQFPGLLVEIWLEEVLRPDQQHLIQIEFDPSIGIDSPPHKWEITLRKARTIFEPIVKISQGNVTWSSSNSQGGIIWRVTVEYSNGNPAKYDVLSARRV